jgi:putative transposase
VIRIILKCLGAVGWIEARFKGPIYLRGECGELRIRHDAHKKKWFGRMYAKWRRHIRHYINARVREAIEWLYDVGVSTIKVGYPKGITQENGDFNNVHVWTYRYLLKRISEVAEEYRISVIYVDEAYTSSRCPLHGDGCGVRIIRGLFRYTTMNKVFNADLVAAYNIQHFI